MVLQAQPMFPPQQCPACKRPVWLLGQWSPADSQIWLCRDCCQQYPEPDVLYVKANGKLGIRKDAPMTERERRVWLETVLYELAKGCVYTMNELDDTDSLPCDHLDHDPYHNCRRCVRSLKIYTKRIRAGEQPVIAWAKRRNQHMYNYSSPEFYQLSMPICKRCGEIHGRYYEHGMRDARTYCQACDDKNHVEAIFRNRGIFGDADDEEALDKIYKAYPGIFERGLLPDYWYELKQKEKEDA